MAKSIFSDLRSLTCDVAFGSSSLTACVSSGAVMMKMTSSTSITSMSGTMLISAIGAPALLESKLAKAMAAPSGGGRPAGQRAHVGRGVGRHLRRGGAAERLAHRHEGVQLVG